MTASTWSLLVWVTATVSMTLASPIPGAELSLWDSVLEWAKYYHYEPKVLADGLSHHFYKEEQPDQALAPGKAASLEELWKDFHFVPRVGEDGKYHFWYGAPPADKHMDFVTIYRSDISNAPLEYGKFYHKLGSSYDITDKEFDVLSSEEKKRYVRIDSPDDLEHVIRDWGHQTAQVTRVDTTPLDSPHPPAANGIPVVKYRSDVSRQPLEFGKFYHKRGTSVDVTEEEYENLPQRDRVWFVRIDGADDLKRYASDWNTPALLPPDDPTPPHSPQALSSNGNGFAAAEIAPALPRPHATSPVHMRRASPVAMEAAPAAVRHVEVVVKGALPRQNE